MQKPKEANWEIKASVMAADWRKVLDEFLEDRQHEPFLYHPIVEYT
jgi:hypothetical protein